MGLGFTLWSVEDFQLDHIVFSFWWVRLPDINQNTANGDAGRPAIFEAPRRRSRAPDDGGGTRLALLECTASVHTTGRAEKCVVDGLIPAFNGCGRDTYRGAKGR